jgi:hypothetical protein
MQPIFTTRLKKVLVSLMGIVLVHASLLAQWIPSSWLLAPDSSWKNQYAMILVHGEGAVGGSQMDMAFYDRMVRGGRMSNEYLQELDDKANFLNRAGAHGSAGISFWNMRDTLFNKPHWGLRIHANTNAHASLSYSEDLFHLVFRGNGDRGGDTLQLGPLSGEFQSWQKFGVGIFDKKTFSGVNLSFVSGSALQSIGVQSSSLYTSPSGDSLALQYRGDYWRSDTLKNGFANGAGIGMAIDADYNLPLEANRAMISLSVRDFGFVRWNQNVEHYAFDSTTVWKGLNTENIFDLATDTLGFPNLEDSLHFDRTNGQITTMLPMSMHVRFSQFFATSHFYEVGVSIWPNRAAVPLVYAGLTHFLTDHFVIREQVSFGGYGKWGVGAEIQYIHKWMISAGVKHLGGWFLGGASRRDLSVMVGRVF